MREPQVRHWKDGRAVRITATGHEVDTRQKCNESDAAFQQRLEGGLVFELVPDFIAAMRSTRAKGTVKQYRSDYNSMLREPLGPEWLTECDAAVYEKLLTDILETKGLARFLAARRTLGALIAWAVKARRWPASHPAFGGAEYRRVTSRALARNAPVIVNEREGRLITIDDCPTWEETCAFAEAVGDAAAARWGEHARALGALPKVQYLTGTRIATTFTLRTSSFNLRRGVCHVLHQGDRNTPWPVLRQPTPGDLEAFAPPLILNKAKRPKGHDASLWEWTPDVLEPILADADINRAGWLFATLLPYRWPLRELGDFLGKVRKDVGYRWTPHAHRHAYASWNLHPRNERGYGKSAGTVASWIGDRVETVQSTYWHPSVDPEAGWSLHRPGSRS